MVDAGLSGVVVAETELSHVDGEAGELVIRGVPVAQLAAAGAFEGAMALLWDGGFDHTSTHREALGRARCALWPRLVDDPALSWSDGAACLRAVLARLDGADPTELVAATGLVAIGFAARRAGTAVAAPDPGRAHADDLVRMLRGAPDEARARALSAYLCTVVDHGMNASTFAARVVASTGTDVTSVVVAAVGALKGPLHGGAPGPVLDMLDAIGTPTAAEKWIQAELDAGRRIMGMGHRIYRVRDPRVAVLEEALQALEAGGVRTERLALAREVERVAERELARRKPAVRPKANVEFATAILLEAIGFDRSAFTAVFATGRVVGWLAHAAEQRRLGRLVRPASRYVGPAIPSA